MHILPVLSPKGFQVYLSGAQFDLLIALVAATLLLLSALVVYSLYQWHTISLLNLAATSTSATTHQTSKEFLSYWLPRPHLPPISRARAFLYTAADITCLVGCYIIYLYDWACWAAAAIHFAFMSMLVFAMAELPYRYHQFSRVTGFIPNQYRLAGIASFVVAVIFGYGPVATLKGIALLSLAHTLLTLLYEPEMKLRFKSVTNQNRLGPGFSPMTPRRPFTTPRTNLVHAHGVPPSQNVSLPASDHRHAPNPATGPHNLPSMSCNNVPRSPAANYRPRVMYPSVKQCGEPIPNSLMQTLGTYLQPTAPTFRPSTLRSFMNAARSPTTSPVGDRMSPNEELCASRGRPNVSPSTPTTQMSSLPSTIGFENRNPVYSPNVLDFGGHSPLGGMNNRIGRFEMPNQFDLGNTHSVHNGFGSPLDNYGARAPSIAASSDPDRNWNNNINNNEYSPFNVDGMNSPSFLCK